MKYLIAGLGNIGEEYANSRHNIGFLILDKLAEKTENPFKLNRHAFTSGFKFKGRTFVLIKPTTFMNLSGKAISYWLQREKIPIEKFLVITDDIALPFGLLRMRPKGGDGGHKGLKSINELIGSTAYARLRFGIGNEYSLGGQVDYVLSQWTQNEQKALPARTDQAIEMVKSFGTIGVQRTMTNYNNK